MPGTAITAPATIYRVEQLPVFQNRMFHTAEDARNCPRGNVELVQDPFSGLILNRAFRQELMQYAADYHNEQALSSVFQSHLANVAKIIRSHFDGLPLIEVGCGKGHFLELLKVLGFDISGIDPAYEGSDASIRKEYFTSSCGLRAGGVILRHVLEHIQDPIGFLSQIRDANGGKGKVYIEVPCLDWICERHAWYDIFYEHVNYFRLSDFQRIFSHVYDLGRIFNGQYLYVVAELASLREAALDRFEPFEFPSAFLQSVNRYATRLKNGNGGTRAIWGAASKGVIFALFMERAGACIDMIIDINPAKQGKYVPGTGLQVHSPDAAMSKLASNTDIFVMNGNYLQEIRALAGSQFNYVTVDDEPV